jgi:hypothetical protein
MALEGAKTSVEYLGIASTGKGRRRPEKETEEGIGLA